MRFVGLDALYFAKVEPLKEVENWSMCPSMLNSETIPPGNKPFAVKVRNVVQQAQSLPVINPVNA